MSFWENVKDFFYQNPISGDVAEPIDQESMDISDTSWTTLETEHKVYLFWYETDRHRFHQEQQILHQAGFRVGKLNNGKLTGSGTLSNREIGIVFSHIHPIEAPDVFVLDGSLLPKKLLTEGGSIDYLLHKAWQPQTCCVQMVLEEVKLVLSFCDQINEQTSSNEFEDTLE